jgi:hypothetical protein
MRELFDGLDRAVYDTVHGYVDPATRQRGAVGLAPRINLQPGTLSNKANPTMETHQLSLRESVPVQLQANDFRILQAYSLLLGHVCYQLPAADAKASDVELLDQYAQFHSAVGEKATAIRTALADGDISPAEMTDIRARFEAMVRCGLGLLSRLEALCDARH